MTKEILKLTANFLGLDKLTDYLSNEEETASDEVKADVNQLLIFMNYIVREITKDYFPLCHKESIMSDSDGKIYFDKLSKKAIMIKDVKNLIDLSCHYEIYPEYIKLENPNTEYKVFYNYTPKTILNITEEAELPFGLDYFIVCYGIASEYCLSKGSYDEAHMWESKFVSALKSIKNRNKERRFFARRLK